MPHADGEPVVVDISFASHFELPTARPGFQRMLQRLPATFAGSTQQLVELVQQLGKHIAAEYLVQVRVAAAWHRPRFVPCSSWLPTHGNVPRIAVLCVPVYISCGQLLTQSARVEAAISDGQL